jgi:hypothetical protein
MGISPPTAGPMGRVLSLPKHEHNLLCFSLAEEEIKTEQEAVEGMDTPTRSKGEYKSCIIYPGTFFCRRAASCDSETALRQ